MSHLPGLDVYKRQSQCPRGLAQYFLQTLIGWRCCATRRGLFPSSPSVDWRGWSFDEVLRFGN